jgi:hypothetical protein
MPSIRHYSERSTGALRRRRRHPRPGEEIVTRELAADADTIGVLICDDADGMRKLLRIVIG